MGFRDRQSARRAYRYYDDLLAGARNRDQERLLHLGRAIQSESDLVIRKTYTLLHLGVGEVVFPDGLQNWDEAPLAREVVEAYEELQAVFPALNLERMMTGFMAPFRGDDGPTLQQIMVCFIIFLTNRSLRSGWVPLVESEAVERLRRIYA